MFNNIIFIGGIHGVGKSTICHHICSELNIEYLSASELLKWKDINENAENKKVENIPFTQNRLITGIKETVQKDKKYLLDGHYCLFNKDNEVENISLDTFKQIKPIAFILISGDISEIKQRLETRDNKPYEYKLLEHLQNSELAYSKSLSEILNIPLYIEKNDDYLNVIDSLREIIEIN